MITPRCELRRRTRILVFAFERFLPAPELRSAPGEILRHTSDCDLLAVRPPHVFEEVGGQITDWDDKLVGLFADRLTLGLICEVETGHFDRRKLFEARHVFYSLARLGLVPDPPSATERLINGRHVDLEGNIRIAKLLIASKQTEGDEFYCVPTSDIRRFLRCRFEKYSEAKFRDRHFFLSESIQALIAESHSNETAENG